MESDAEAQPGELSPTDGEIVVALDRLSRAALSVLTADGTRPNEAVRTAILDAAERYVETPPPSPAPTGSSRPFEAQVAASVAAAPPFSPYQRYMLTAVFVEGRTTWLSESQWKALRDRSASDDA